MNKILLKGIALVALFFALWFGFSQVNWLSVFKVDDNTRKTEKKLGEKLWEFYRNTEEEIRRPVIVNTVDSLITEICKANKIDRKEIRLHIVEKEEVNAFALPDGHLVVYSGLILDAKNQEELCGVLCHEIAHITQHHVMRKLVKEVGLTMLVSVSTGNGGTDLIATTARTLSSTAFDRSMEQEADLKAVDYMLNANINPAPFADFLYKMSEEDPDNIEYLSWVSTHPDSRERAEAVVDYSINKKKKFRQIITPEGWKVLQDKLNDQ